MTGSFYLDHQHTRRMSVDSVRTRSTAETYASVVGTVEVSTELPIMGRSGDHLQFYVDVGAGARYQVDVNTQSSAGTEVGVCIRIEQLTPAGGTPQQPFGPPVYGVDTGAALSYAQLGLVDSDFTPLSTQRIQSLLESTLNQSSFVDLYGMVFDDGGPRGQGVHETHYTGLPDQDGAVLIYLLDATGKPTRQWFFFKFAEDSIPALPA